MYICVWDLAHTGGRSSGQQPRTSEAETLFGRAINIQRTTETSGGLLSLDMSEVFPTSYGISGSNGYQVSASQKQARF